MKSQIYRISRLAIAVAVAVLSQGCRAAHTEKATVDQESLVDELMYVIVPTEMESHIVKYPGYVLSFNSEYHQPNWVAWELTRDEAKATDISRRGSVFQTDMDVKGCANTYDYRNSGYTRGHMCPAGDMRWDQDAMNSCFMLTNITPQAEELNNGAWKNLEEKCRYWAQRDSAIVIICGPILTDSLTATIGDSQIPVPERFFKVVLAPYSKPMRAIGFIMDNGYVEGGLQQSAVSVRLIEEITGLDFFAPLPDDLENSIETECNFPRWSAR